MKFEKYVRILESFLRRHWAVAESQLTVEKYTIEHGYIDGKIILLDGSYIDFSEEILIVEKIATKPYYRYEFVKDKAGVFRYDNFAKHPEILLPITTSISPNDASFS